MVSRVMADHITVSEDDAYLALESIVIEADVYVVYGIRSDRDRLEVKDVIASYWTGEGSASQ